MNIRDVFPPEFIIVNLVSGDKDTVFEEMVDHFCTTSKKNVRDDILDAIRTREAKMSTGIQKGVALPHGTSNAVDTVSGVLGISPKGVEYDALDNEPVHLLFMLFAPRKDAENHLQLLKNLSELLEKPQFYKDLLAQKDPQGVYDIICQYEK
jgi:PTS system fructose-specific IIC component/PTS system nitrogen regulatory IIA component